jgi:FkbM family methyltransferase
MIDVGAHHDSALRKFADNAWSIFAFEPDKNNRKILIDKYATYPNITIDPRGCSDKEEINVPFFTSDESTGISGLSSFVDSHIEISKVDITTLSKYIEDNQIQDVDFLKIDTEGFDYFVLKGFPFEKIKPKVIVCEFEDNKTIPLGYVYQNLGYFLKEQGYEVILSEWYPIKRYGIAHDWNCFKVFQHH